MKRFIKWLSIAFVLLIVSIQSLFFFLPLPPLLGGLSYSRAVFDEHHQLLRLTLSDDAKFRWKTPLTEIAPQLIEATLLQEDQYFRWHFGVNPLSILKAAWQTYLTGPRRLGASTITMQVARIRFAINSKTFSGKVLQMVRALQIEMFYSKRQILEAYLNLAPYGNNIEGVGSASLIYFGKSAKDLTLPEALSLAIIPQNPSKRTQNPVVLKQIRNKLFLRWLVKHPADKNKKALMELPLVMRNLRSAPFLAPHFVNEVLSNADFTNDPIVTTLDLRMQKIVERITRNYLARKANLGVTNAAVLLVDSRDMGIKAMLGSGNFFNEAIAGQINGTETRRSPGSTLKPFIYALALDQGLIHEATVLKDVPHSFGAYNPENFDNDFVGPIKAKDALILSRNIPAVYLADQLKKPNLYEFLQQGGIRNLKSETYYGLALVLGGAELSMQELVGLYAALANDGVWHPLRFSKAQKYDMGKRLLSPEASFLVLEMLKGADPRGGNYGTKRRNSKTFAWKTGTSSGYRDAWTVGVVGPYVIAVWIGNFNNQSNRAFIGKEIAAPLFFEIVAALNLPSQSNTENRPELMHLTQVNVCKASGMLPTRYCTDTEKIWFIPGKSPIKSDTIHREVAIDMRTGLRACHFNEYTRFEVYEFWSSDLLQIFKRAGIARRLPPPYDPSCTVPMKPGGFQPQIISPQLQVDYVARLNTKTIIPFSAVVDADVSNVYWFLNETFLGKESRDQPFMWQAKPGNYVLRVVDDYGRSDARNLKVRLAG